MALAQRNFARSFESASLRQDDRRLFRCRQGLVESRLATIRYVFVNDSALGSFIDCGD